MSFKGIVRKIIPKFIMSWYHLSFAFLAALRYGFPSRKMVVVGITGTNGKSTTLDLAHRVLEQTGSGVASCSSVRFKINETEWPNMLKMTMPGRFFLQKFLKRANKAKCKYAIIEVTSEGILQHRNKFIDFDIAIFTNLSPEHIERHGSFEKYREAKAKFFKQVKGLHIMNMDDEHAPYFLQIVSKEKIGYTADGQGSFSGKLVTAKNIQDLGKGVSFQVGNVIFELNLLGRFNVYNALGAICLGLSQGLSLEQCEKALETAEGIPGRMETIYLGPFKAVIDYAFTPNALKQVYKTLAAKSKEQMANRLVCVLGACGGGRDKWKRPVLGEIAKEYCEQIIVTNEDPYDEPPEEIIDQVVQGAGPKALKIVDRRKAINKALSLAKQGDIVIITGKGCEPWICVENGKKIAWDDRQVVKEEAKGLGIALAPEAPQQVAPQGKKALISEMKRLQRFKDPKWH
ncbi:UDP-N-acetylmuramoyl-L-alanyl-D-glutamate--2,6-diaminopimelate ligase [Candidatus Parcubacteria bacterium]|nr:UDP-N-acetylmuramoyl-L-alanyl-D-glutamate--2,6-diaminopimelate ligase [Candidatus Parcubacteria bacterium]